MHHRLSKTGLLVSEIHVMVMDGGPITNSPYLQGLNALEQRGGEMQRSGNKNYPPLKSWTHGCYITLMKG